MRVQSAAITTGIVLACYLASPPFAVLFLLKTGLHPSSEKFLSTLYGPITPLYYHFPPYKMMIDAEFRMLGLR